MLCCRIRATTRAVPGTCTISTCRKGQQPVHIPFTVHVPYEFVHNNMNLMATSIPLTLRNSLPSVVGPTASHPSGEFGKRMATSALVNVAIDNRPSA
jgi:hypothetical protein